tara:strand:+ start:1649 stop:1816 length:168 start_codon:yes stop_codon:yes gene_type:complete
MIANYIKLKIITPAIKIITKFSAIVRLEIGTSNEDPRQAQTIVSFFDSFCLIPII